MRIYRRDYCCGETLSIRSGDIAKSKARAQCAGLYAYHVGKLKKVRASV